MIYYIKLLEEDNVDGAEETKRARKLKSSYLLIIDFEEDLEINYSEVIIESGREIEIYSLSLFSER